MAFSLVIDDTSLSLLLGIIVTLCLSIYVSPSYQPLLHPLILARQADVSKVRRKGHSSIYRNANAPQGFDLASRPRRAISDVGSLIKVGATGAELNKERQLLGKLLSNAQFAAQAAAFGAGVVSLASSPPQHVVLGISSTDSSLSTLTALAAGSLQSSPGKTFHTVVLPARALSASKPTSLPTRAAASGARSISVLFTTPSDLADALQLSLLDGSAVVVVPDASDVITAQEVISKGSGSHRLRVVSFDAVLAAGDSAAKETASALSLAATHDDNAADAKTIEAAGAVIHSAFWTTAGSWVEIANASLAAGVTAHLGFSSADKIPTTADRIFIEQNSTAGLGLASSPAGFVLALLALYTGAALSSGPITTVSNDKKKGNVSAAFKQARPTLLFVSPNGASTLGFALTSTSKRSVLLRFAARAKLSMLRHGALTQSSIWDRIVFGSTRAALSLSQLRSVTILGPGSTISQGLLDILRAQLGCPVISAYLPNGPVKSGNGDVALVTAPVSASHIYDFQAFAPHLLQGVQLPAHVGPPSVTLEVELISSARAKEAGFLVDGPRDDAMHDDPMGEICIRGKTLAGEATTDRSTWFSTADFGAFRANGTMVVIRDAGNSEPVEVANLGPDFNRLTASKAGRRVIRSGAPLTLLTFATLSLCACLLTSVQAYDVRSGSSYGHSPLIQLAKRASGSPNETLANAARMGMYASQRASWEQGVAISAILEFEHGDWSTFAGQNGGPPYRPAHLDLSKNGHPPFPVMALAYHSVRSQDGSGRLSSRVTGDENVTVGATQDSASSGEGVLLSAFVEGEIANFAPVSPEGTYARAARRQLEYLIGTNRLLAGPAAGAISQRVTTLELWSDGAYMGPPFFATYGLIYNNQTLLQLAYDQLRLYRAGLRINDGAATGLWSHIYNATNITSSDTGAWLTGNGWAASGMVRVLSSLTQANGTWEDQKNDLANWTEEIFDAAYPFADPSTGLLRNYINDTTQFLDASGSAALAYATFRLGSISQDRRAHIAAAERIYSSIQASLDPVGVHVASVESVDALGFTTAGYTSPESLAFLVLMEAARRDFHQGNTTGFEGPGTAYDAATMPTPPLRGVVVALAGVLAVAVAVLL